MAASELYNLFTHAFHTFQTRDPNRRASLGVQRDLGALPDPSLEASQADIQIIDTLLATASAFDLSALNHLSKEKSEQADPRAASPKGEPAAAPEGGFEALGFEEALDVSLACLMLRAEKHQRTLRFNGKTRLEQLPSAGNDIGDGLFTLFINDPREPSERIEDIQKKLEAVPEYLDALLARLNTPVSRWVQMDLAKVAGLGELFDTINSWAETVAPARAAALSAASQAAQTALNSYAEALKGLPTTAQIAVGDETMREIIRLRGIELPPEELHQIAARFLAETKQQIEALRGKLVEKYGLAASTSSDALQEFLAERFRVSLPNGKLEDILERYQAERAKVLAFIEEHDLFPVPAAQNMLVLRTPGFLAPSIPAGAMTSPAPFLQGTKTSVIYLTLSDELVAEHTELSIPSMMIHEGIPGHHLQLSWGSLHPSIIRRHIDAMDHAEGWTTMLEDYMLDVGYAEGLADEVRFSTKRDIARIGARVAIDLFFMSGDKKYLDVGVECDLSSNDPFISAGNLLRAVTGFVPERVQAELNWYSQERGYPLSYLTGNHLVWQLKRELIAAQQGKLEGRELDRTFHRVYLESGNMPVRYLRQVFQAKGLL